MSQKSHCNFCVIFWEESIKKRRNVKDYSLTRRVISFPFLLLHSLIVIRYYFFDFRTRINPASRQAGILDLGSPCLIKLLSS